MEENDKDLVAQCLNATGELRVGEDLVLYRLDGGSGSVVPASVLRRHRAGQERLQHEESGHQPAQAIRHTGRLAAYPRSNSRKMK